MNECRLFHYLLCASYMLHTTCFCACGWEKLDHSYQFTRSSNLCIQINIICIVSHLYWVGTLKKGPKQFEPHLSSNDTKIHHKYAAWTGGLVCNSTLIVMKAEEDMMGESLGTCGYTQNVRSCSSKL